jgi:hypothetical protein
VRHDRSLFRHGRRRCRCLINRRRSDGRCLDGDLFLARSRCRGRLHHHASRRRRHNNHGTRRRYSSCGRLGNNRARGRTRGDGWSGRRSRNNRRRRARLRNDLAWFRTGRRGRDSGRRGNRSSGRRGRFRRHDDRRFRGDSRVARLFFLFFLLGQKGLHHIAGSGDVRKIDFWDDCFCAVTARRRACMRGVARLPRKVRTNLLSLVQLQRAGVRLARRNAQFRKKVENRPGLNFQLFREIVDSNLTHPPLFNVCVPKGP